jgi:hypothetical protein
MIAAYSRGLIMLDIHPAHHAASTWRDFFIHIATIVLGLLIAIGLEQTVEWMHHRHQLHQLEADLHTEGIRNLHIALDNIHGAELRRQSDADQYAEFLLAAREHRAPAAYPAQFIMYTRPAYAVWTVAQQSGTLDLLPREDALSYARLYGVVQSAVDQVKPINTALDRRNVAMLPAASDPTALRTLLQSGQALPAYDLSLLNPEELREARDAVGDDMATSRQSVKWNVYLYGIEWAVLHGSRSDEENVRTFNDAINVYTQGGTAALLAKYPLPE